jgi:AraC-like DNA-binding protein
MVATSHPIERQIPQASVDLNGLPERQRLDVWRNALEPIFEITPIDSQVPRPFGGALTMSHLGDALVSRVQSDPQIFERSHAHARRSGIDHFMVQTFLRGEHDGACGESTFHRAEGDVWILDLGRETKTVASNFTNVTLIIPRDRLLPRLKGGDIHGTTLRSGTASALLIANHLKMLMTAAPDLRVAEATAAVDAAALMIAGAWSRIRESRAEVSAAVRATARRVVCDYIDAHLNDHRLTPETLAYSFHMSRATLYRLFEDEGGIVAYILGRRLDRCYAILATSLDGERTIGAIAFEHGFASDAHFSRAFRRRFGMAPGDARRMGGGTAVRRETAHANAQAVSDWIATLRQHQSRLDMR